MSEIQNKVLIITKTITIELTTTISDRDTAARMNEFYAFAIDPEVIARAIDAAIEQPGE
jgi:hypothetical protein